MNNSNPDDEKNEVGGSYFQKVTSDLSIGAELIYDVSNTDNRPKLVFGSQYRLRHDSIVKVNFHSMERFINVYL